MNGADECGIGIMGPELSADLTDQNVNIAIIGVPLPVPDLAH